MLEFNISQLPSPEKGLFLVDKIRCKKTFENSRGGILKSGSAKNNHSRNFGGEGVTSIWRIPVLSGFS